VALYIVMIFSRSYKVTLVCMFLMGGTTSGKLGVGFPYLVELLGKKYRPLYATMMNVASSLVGVIGTLYFVYVSKNAYYFMWGGFVWQLSSLFASRWIPESPIYYLHKGMLKEGEQALQFMADLNGKKLIFDKS
jgi:hypothetical protein